MTFRGREEYLKNFKKVPKIGTKKAPVFRLRRNKKSSPLCGAKSPRKHRCSSTEKNKKLARVPLPSELILGKKREEKRHRK